MAKTKKKKKQVVYPVFFMILVTVVFVTTLAVINEATKDQIAKQEALRIKETLLYVFNIEVADDASAIESAYDQYLSVKTINGQEIYVASENGETTGYAFELAGAGLWGSMSGYAAVDESLQYILGMSFVSHSETPGLGGRIDEIWFKDQFRGIAVDLDAQTYIFRPSEGGNVDSISGATLTSEAVRKIINADVVNFIETVGGDL
jgi:Na+-transporting NADH:ubiquinone oxidoreductase subunit C